MDVPRPCPSCGRPVGEGVRPGPLLDCLPKATAAAGAGAAGSDGGKAAPELPSCRVQIEVRLDEVVLRALEKEPEQHYRRAGEASPAVAAATQDPMPPAGPVARGQPMPAMGACSSQRVVSWPDVLFTFVLVLALAEAGAVFVCTALTGTADSRAVTVAAVLAVVVAGLLCRRGLTVEVGRRATTAAGCSGARQEDEGLANRRQERLTEPATRPPRGRDGIC